MRVSVFRTEFRSAQPTSPFRKLVTLFLRRKSTTASR